MGMFFYKKNRAYRIDGILKKEQYKEILEKKSCYSEIAISRIYNATG